MYLFYRPKKKVKAERVENGRMKPIENLFAFINEIENDFPGLSWVQFSVSALGIHAICSSGI